MPITYSKKTLAVVTGTDSSQYPSHIPKTGKQVRHRKSTPADQIDLFVVQADAGQDSVAKQDTKQVVSDLAEPQIVSRCRCNFSI